MNPLGNALPVQNSVLQGIAQTVRFAQSFKSPELFMQELQRQNPQMAQYLMQISQTIKNPNLAAQQMLAQQGISMQQLQAALNQY